MALRVLIVQSDSQAAQTLARFFRERGDEVWVVLTTAQAQARLAAGQTDLMLLDLHFPGSDWLDLLRQVQTAPAHVKVILTNKYPDLQRELRAADYGATVILRQPYTQRWIEAAVRRVWEAADTQKQRAAQAQLPPVRFPVRVKITAPYLLLALLFALASAFVVTQVLLESVQNRYLNQLTAAGREAEDWMVREEQRLLGTERLVANSQGLAQAIHDQNAEAVRALIFPLGVNANEDALEIIDMQGLSLLSMRKTAGSGPAAFQFSRGDGLFGQQPFVRNVLLGNSDAVGDKYAGLVSAAWGDYFYVAGPIYDESNQVVGAALVGRTVTGLTSQAARDTLTEVSLYDLQGNLLTSSLFSVGVPEKVNLGQVIQLIENQSSQSLTRPLQLGINSYTEILGPWEARNKQDLGLMGVALTQNSLVQTSSGVQVEIFLMVAGAILLVIVVGVSLANRITRPLTRLVKASAEIAQGNLEVKVDSNGNDELAVMAHSFNTMVAGLQEGSVYRDLLGRTVSPEVRDQLRQTFTSGGIRLEGQEAVASVLMADIRGFTTLSEQVEPAMVLSWLNEYFGRLVPIIQGHGGVVNKFDGDAILAFFGILPARLSPKDSATAACQAAQEMMCAIETLNVTRAQRGDPPLVTGIGINTGIVIAGGLGTSDRLHYTIIGDTVNTTQRLESLTRELFNQNGIVIGNQTFQALEEQAGQFCLEAAGPQVVKGKTEKILVYRLLHHRPEPVQVTL